jgi:hypothetical protein
MRRGVIAVALICAFVVLAVYYQANITQHLDYPSEREVSANYAQYVGQNVTISGGVVATGVAVKLFASPQLWGELVYVRSFIALIFLAVLFFVSWRFDWRAFVFRPREKGRKHDQISEQKVE